MNLIPRYVLYETYPVLCLYRQTYSGIFTFYSDICSHIVAYLEPFVNLTYPEPRHIQNPGIFGTRDIFRALSKHFPAYSERCVTLANWERCRVQNFAIFRMLAYLRPEAYSESCLFWHTQAYLGILNNDSYN